MYLDRIEVHLSREMKEMALEMPENSSVLAVIGENIDRLCTLEMRPSGSSHAVIHKLYAAAREHTGTPLALNAAQQLAERIQPGDFVILATGAGHPLFLPQGETDGPIGTVALARMLAEGIGALPVIVTEQAHLGNVRATAVAGGLGLRSLDEVSKVPVSTAVLPFPADDAGADQVSRELLDQLQPAAVIAIEKLGPNAAGVAHTATGMPAGDERARVERLIMSARERRVLTVGIGDNGNEIGFGVIYDAVRAHKPFGRVCQCPCGRGLATVVETDALVVAGTSNWGAYGVEACLSAILGRVDLIHSNDAERFMLYENVRAGGVDGSTARQVPQVDGTSAEVQTSILELMRACVRHGLSEPFQRPF